METNNKARVNDVQTTFEIPLDEARQWVKAWADGGSFVKGFLIDADELRSIIDQKEVCYLRVYFAWDDALEEGRREKLVMVPANEYGNDMVPKDEDHSNVFDFTLPCPPTCDVNSPLFFPTKTKGEK